MSGKVSGFAVRRNRKRGSGVGEVQRRQVEFSSCFCFSAGSRELKAQVMLVARCHEGGKLMKQKEARATSTEPLSRWRERCLPAGGKDTGEERTQRLSTCRALRALGVAAQEGLFQAL